MFTQDTTYDSPHSEAIPHRLKGLDEWQDRFSKFISIKYYLMHQLMMSISVWVQSFWNCIRTYCKLKHKIFFERFGSKRKMCKWAWLSHFELIFQTQCQTLLSNHRTRVVLQKKTTIHIRGIHEPNLRKEEKGFPTILLIQSIHIIFWRIIFTCFLYITASTAIISKSIAI